MVTMEMINMYLCYSTLLPPRPTTVLVSVMLANNETGIIMVRAPHVISSSSHPTATLLTMS